MKKVLIAFFSIFLTILISQYSSCENVSAHTKSFYFSRTQNVFFELEQRQEFILPNSLVAIDESAFEGTGTSVIWLSDKVEIISDNAFSNIDPLIFIIVPDSVQHIGTNAIDKNVTLIGTNNSYSHEWAKANNRHISLIPTLKEYKSPNFTLYSVGERTKLSRLFIIAYRTTDNYRCSQGLTIGEQKSLRFSRNTDFRIDGRAPPHAYSHT